MLRLDGMPQFQNSEMPWHTMQKIDKVSQVRCHFELINGCDFKYKHFFDVLVSSEILETVWKGYLKFQKSEILTFRL